MKFEPGVSSYGTGPRTLAMAFDKRWSVQY